VEKELTIRPLLADDAGPLAALLAAEPPEYLAHFHPFPFDTEAIRERLAGAKRDRYWSLLAAGQIAGFFMLRGFDAGYARPSFGVYVGSRHSGLGLARLALQFSLAWSRVNGVESVMLKVHSENAAARRVYLEAGFKSDSICPNTGHEMFVWQRPRR